MDYNSGLMMGDKIILHGIQFFGYHGVSPQERQVGGRYAVDVELEYDLRAAGRSDNLADTLSYSPIHKLVLSIGQEQRFHLIEALAEAIAQAILEKFPADAVTVCVKKQPPPMAGILDYTAVEIRRQRSTFER